jgi:hypothetical protein
MMMMHELDVTYTDTFSPDPSRFLLTLGGCRSSGKTAGKQRENSGKTAEMGRQVAGTIPPWARPIRHFGRSEKAVRMLD